jgi:sigma-B regulation protein RsbU (phosphoserine phosphatase)
MKLKNEKKGLIFLGNRITKQEYSKSDIEYISSISSFAIISIENARLIKEEIEKQKIEKDLEIARNIQQNLLPKKFPYSKEYQIAAINKTAKRVGGDYYDIVKLDEKRLLIAIADVSGKGIQASLLMANLQAFLKSIYKQNYTLEEASNIETKEFTYVNMGHNPPLLVRGKEIIKLKKGGMILGVMKTLIPYESEKVKLQSDDSIVLFTDGVTEAMNQQNQEYSDERLEELSIKYSSKSAEAILNAILKDLEFHTSGAEQSDDITSLILKMN